MRSVLRKLVFVPVFMIGVVPFAGSPSGHGQDVQAAADGIPAVIEVAPAPFSIA